MKTRVRPTLLFISAALLLSGVLFVVLPLSAGSATMVTTTLDPNLVAYWKMEEVNGATIVDSSGHGYDLGLVNAHNPTDIPTLSSDFPTAVVSNTYSLSFTGSFAQEAKYAYGPDITQTSGNSQLTVETWAKMDASPSFNNTQTLVAAFNTGVATQWWLGIGGGEVWVIIADNSAYEGGPSLTQPYGRSAGANLQPGQWYHIAFVYDGSGATHADRLKIYVDGIAKPISFYDARPIPTTLTNSHPTIRLGNRLYSK